VNKSYILLSSEIKEKNGLMKEKEKRKPK